MKFEVGSVKFEMGAYPGSGPLVAIFVFHPSHFTLPTLCEGVGV